ncbi:hypothetical protein RUND412_009584 [Rhizina undulata]
MTTFTRLPDNETPRIDLDPSHIITPIADEIYSGFTEHMGRCVYGGLYDPGNPLSDENGFRKDVIEAFKELNCPVVRYPGGNFVATYHWYEGVGPVEKRPRRPELAWEGVESNVFGTDEFMKWCEVVGCEPYLALNMGTGTLDEALGWVEYCNSTQDTYWANLRRKNGREEPYNVKYWALGNEVYGDWQIEQSTKEDYAKKARQWAKALKLLDPSLKLILCGATGYEDWDRYVLQECVEWVDMHSIHIYTADKEHYANASAPLAAERAIEITASLIDLARIPKKVTKRPTICFDEWNIWDPIRAPGNKGAEELYTLSDALAMATWCNVFIRQAKYLGMTCIAQSVNVISPLMTTKNGITKQTTWYPYVLFAKYMRGATLAVHLSGGAYEGRTNPAWIESTLDVPWLDVSAAKDGDWINLAVVNRNAEKDFEVEINGVAKETEVTTFLVTGSNLEDVNNEGDEKVGLKQSLWFAGGKYKFLKKSFTLLRWKA